MVYFYMFVVGRPLIKSKVVIKINSSFVSYDHPVIGLILRLHSFTSRRGLSQSSELGESPTLHSSSRRWLMGVLGRVW